MRNILFFGPPGVGKGTYSEKVALMLNLTHINTGGKIREEGEKGTKFGLYSKRLIDVGKLVPNTILIPQMRNWIIEEWNDKGFIFDGYPRSVEQAKDLDIFLTLRKNPITHFILFNAPVEVLRERLRKRGEVSGRADDGPEFFDGRYKRHTKIMKPIIDYFKAKASKISFIEINSNREIEDVVDELNNHILNLTEL